MLCLNCAKSTDRSHAQLRLTIVSPWRSLSHTHTHTHSHTLKRGTPGCTCFIWCTLRIHGTRQKYHRVVKPSQSLSLVLLSSLLLLLLWCYHHYCCLKSLWLPPFSCYCYYYYYYYVYYYPKPSKSASRSVVNEGNIEERAIYIYIYNE